MLITNPQIFKADYGWYIEYYELDDKGQKSKRFQLKCGLNRIKDIPAREMEAAKSVNRILAKYGQKPSAVVGQITSKTVLVKALSNILSILSATYNKTNTIDTIRDMVNSFTIYLKVKFLDQLRCCDLKPFHVQGYFDYLKLERKNKKGQGLSNCTINNHRKNLGWIFNELIARDYLTENHFKKIKKLKEGEPINRAFTDAERDIVMNEIFETDRELSFAILMIYRLGIRSYNELSNLKPMYFDFERNLLKVPGSVSKTNKGDQFVTIPTEIVPWLQSFLKDIPNSWYILGQNVRPNAVKRMGANAMYERHKKILKRLMDKGKLMDITGLTIYQWKHTSTYNLIDKGFTVEEVRDHLRHADINTTVKYFRKRNVVIDKIKNYTTGFVPKV